MPIISGIIGGNAAKRAGNYINYVGQSAGAGVENAGAQAAAGTEAAAGAGQGEINAATGQGQAGVTGAVQSGQAGVNAAGQQAISGVYGATNTANQALGNIYGSQIGMMSPYLQTGATGTNALAGYVNNPFQAPTAAQAEATPGYQFQLQQGLQGVQQQLGATGGGASGGELKALTQYGQGVASTYYQNAFNNALSAYNTNVNTAEGAAAQGLNATGQTNQAAENFGNQYAANTINAGTYAGNTGLNTAMYGSNLGYSGATYNAGLGEQGAQASANMGLQGAITGGNQNMLGAEEGGNFYMQGAQGAAAGTVGQANSYGNAINYGSNLLMGGLMGGFGNIFNPGGTFGSSSGLNSGLPFGSIGPTSGTNPIYGPGVQPGQLVTNMNAGNQGIINQLNTQYGTGNPYATAGPAMPPGQAPNPYANIFLQ